MVADNDTAWGDVEYCVRRSVSAALYWRVYRRLRPCSPHYVPQVVRLLDAWIKKDMRVFEWGSGVSTLWFAARASAVVAVEHNPEWESWVRQRLFVDRVDNVTCLFVPSARDVANYDWHAQWTHWAELGHPPRKPEFKDYIASIDAYPDGFFDLIVLDGREWVGCALHAALKLAAHDIVMLDDSQRRKYEEVFSVFSLWRHKRLRFGGMETTVFWRQGPARPHQRSSPWRCGGLIKPVPQRLGCDAGLPGGPMSAALVSMTSLGRPRGHDRVE